MGASYHRYSLVPFDELTPAQQSARGLAVLGEQALSEQLEQALAVLPAEEADQIRAEVAAAKSAEAERVLAEERASAAQALSPAERERQGRLMPLVSEGKADCAEWRDRQIGLGEDMTLTTSSSSGRRPAVSIDLARVRRRDRERLMRIPLNRPGRLRRGILVLRRPPICRGARARPRARGRRERRTVRSSARSGDSGSTEPGGDGEPHGRCHYDDVVLPGRWRP